MSQVIEDLWKLILLKKIVDEGPASSTCADAGNEKIGCSGEPFWLSLSSKLNLASTIQKKLELRNKHRNTHPYLLSSFGKSPQCVAKDPRRLISNSHSFSWVPHH